MEWKEILESICLILIMICGFMAIITAILDIKESNKYWKSMYARMDLFEASLKKEHDLLKKTQEFNEWLDTFLALMYTNVKLEDNEFNQGVLKAAADIEGKFLEMMGEYVDGEESSD